MTTKEKLVRYGTVILTEKGLASTGLDEILKTVGVPKGSFYHYFASKDDFGLAVIQHYETYFANKLDRCLWNKNRTPLDCLADFIEEAKDGMTRHAFKRGCLIGNLGQELGALNEKFRVPLEKVFLDWQNRVADCLERAKTTGQISSQTDSQEMAAFFWIGWEGAILRAKLVKSCAPLDLFAKHFFNSF
ncbi:MAG: TetR/AcrR family transcriptional regulator [Sneathiella sp.]|nr:TetR/AcrR family transcriptional regulator [Sneathiella sp.]